MKSAHQSLACPVDYVEVISIGGEAIGSIKSPDSMHFAIWSTLYDMFKFQLLDKGTTQLETHETDRRVTFVI